MKAEKVKTKQRTGEISECATHEIEIVMTVIESRVKKEIRKWFVIPGYQIVKQNDEVVWSTKDTDVRLIFPNKRIFGESELVIRKNQTRSLTVQGRVKSGPYPYAVVTAENGEFAIGGSYPVIIVE